MKIFSTLSVLSAFPLILLQASATSLPPINGPATFNWTINQAVLVDTNTSTKTNVTGHGSTASTNVMEVLKSTDVALTYNSSSILALLENSMNTKFPSGSKLVYAAGTNVLFVVSSSGTVVTDTFLVFAAASTNSAENSSTTDVRTTTKSGTAFSGSGSGNGTEGVIMKYDDSALTTADGTITSFRFVGISAYTHSGSTTSANETTYKISEAETFTITGAGYGIIRGKASTISGTLKASPVGIYTTD